MNHVCRFRYSGVKCRPRKIFGGGGGSWIFIMQTFKDTDPEPQNKVNWYSITLKATVNSTLTQMHFMSSDSSCDATEGWCVCALQRLVHAQEGVPCLCTSSSFIKNWGFLAFSRKSADESSGSKHPNVDGQKKPRKLQGSSDSLKTTLRYM